jgi:cell division protein FtsZ
VATPPFELNKERRREAALHEPPPQIFFSEEVRSEPKVEQVPLLDVPPPIQHSHDDTEVLDPSQEAYSSRYVESISSSPSHEEPPAIVAHETVVPEAAYPVSQNHVSVIPEVDRPVVSNEPAKRPKDGVQEQMRFDAPNRGGRFEKTDPTIVDGEDLDVPTFMRQKLHLE